MVFCFTFFTYNGQRLIRLRKKILKSNQLSERLKWVIRYQNLLGVSSVMLGIIGMVCTFFIHTKCWIIIIPAGFLSVFYVIPLLPFSAKSKTLREINFIKIFIIAIVWSFIIVWIPIIDSQHNFQNIKLYLALLQNFLFIVAITLPFDVRDIHFDKSTQLKTLPQLLGIKKTILLSELLLTGSVLLCFFLPINIYHVIGLSTGYLITMIMILFTHPKRNELFYAGLIEGTVLILYSCVFTADYFSSL